MQLGLSSEEKEQRKQGIGGSDAAKIMKGEWKDLYLIKTGQKEDEDLSDNFRVQLGHVTEKFNLFWLAKEEKLDSYHSPGICTSVEHPFMRCTPDAIGIWDGRYCVIDAKHTNQWVDKFDIYERYYWQLTHNAIVTESPVCIISAIYGNNFASPIVWEVNDEDAKHLIKMEESFWWHVTNNDPPSDISLIAGGTSAPPPLSDMVDVDMTGNNEWASMAEEFKENKEQHDKHAKAKKGLRALVEDNVKLAKGHGIIAKRSNNNSVRITIDKKG
mgnify:CR=1 FL=1